MIIDNPIGKWDDSHLMVADKGLLRDRLSARSSFPAGAPSYQFTMIPLYE